MPARMIKIVLANTGGENNRRAAPFRRNNYRSMPRAGDVNIEARFCYRISVSDGLMNVADVVLKRQLISFEASYLRELARCAS